MQSRPEPNPAPPTPIRTPIVLPTRSRSRPRSGLGRGRSPKWPKLARRDAKRARIGYRVLRHRGEAGASRFAVSADPHFASSSGGTSQVWLDRTPRMGRRSLHTRFSCTSRIAAAIRFRQFGQVCEIHTAKRCTRSRPRDGSTSLDLKKSSGEGGIRTLGTVARTHDLEGMHLRPLGHLSKVVRVQWLGRASRRRAAPTRRCSASPARLRSSPKACSRGLGRVLLKNCERVAGPRCARQGKTRRGRQCRSIPDS